MMETLIVEKRDHLLWIKLNRPDAMNALNTKMGEELLSVLTEAAVDPEIWVVGLTTTSDKAFGVGADLKERKNMTAEQIGRQRALFTRVVFALKGMPQPFIAGIKGFTLGGGLEMALSADILIAGENAQLGLPEVRVGLIPGNGGTQYLPRLIGKNRAKEMIFTAKRITAPEAQAMGIVNRVVPVDKVEEAMEKLAQEILASAPVAVRQAKRSIDMGMDVDLNTGLQIEIEAYKVNLTTEDRQEGIRAFNEKRPPQWKGK